MNRLGRVPSPTSSSSPWTRRAARLGSRDGRRGAALAAELYAPELPPRESGRQKHSGARSPRESGLARGRRSRAWKSRSAPRAGSAKPSALRSRLAATLSAASALRRRAEPGRRRCRRRFHEARHRRAERRPQPRPSASSVVIGTSGSRPRSTTSREPARKPTPNFAWRGAADAFAAEAARVPLKRRSSNCIVETKVTRPWNGEGDRGSDGR